jgi:hypothetical protein
MDFQRRVALIVILAAAAAVPGFVVAVSLGLIDVGSFAMHAGVAPVSTVLVTANLALMVVGIVRFARSRGEQAPS